VRARFGVDQLRVDPHPILVALHRAFEHVTDPELLADRLSVDGLALVRERGIAGDDEAISDAREVSREVLGDAVGEIVLCRITGEIGKGQDDDREVGGLRRFHVAARQEKPAAGGGQNEERSNGGGKLAEA
jgi:hypothetical protein